MRHHILTFSALFAFALVTTVAGASGNEKAATKPAQPPQPEIVYSPYSKPAPLTDAQRNEILAIAREQVAERGDLWFVYVHSNTSGTYAASVYLRATKRGSRVRRGEYVLVDNVVPLAERREMAKRLGGGDWPTLQPYVQVLPADAAAEATKDMSDDGASAAPPEAQLPFSPPPEISDDELVAAVDAARGAVTASSALAAAATGRDGTTLPVHRIESTGDGTVRVYFGWLAGRLHGGGVFVDLKREGAAFKAQGSLGIWVS